MNERLTWLAALVSTAGVAVAAGAIGQDLTRQPPVGQLGAYPSEIRTDVPMEGPPLQVLCQPDGRPVMLSIDWDGVPIFTAQPWEPDCR